jgi:hypothetical protein
MTKQSQRERKRRRQAEFVTDEQQRLLEIEDMRLVVKFGDKRRFSAREYEAIYQELARRDPDAIEAVFKKLNAIDEAETARRDLCGSASTALYPCRDTVRPISRPDLRCQGKLYQPEAPCFWACSLRPAA